MSPSGAAVEPDHEVVSVGAGFSGIGAAIASSARASATPDHRAGGGLRRHVALEPLPGHRGRHPVVQLPVLLRATGRLVAQLRPGPGTALVRHVAGARAPAVFPDALRHGDHRRGVRRGRPRVAADHRRRGHARGASRHRRNGGADRPAATGHRGHRRLRRDGPPHLPLGRVRRPDRHAGRGDRHGRIGRAAHPCDRGGSRARHRLPAHPHLVPAQAGRPPARPAARGAAAPPAALRGTPGQPGVRRGDLRGARPPAPPARHAARRACGARVDPPRGHGSAAAGPADAATRSAASDRASTTPTWRRSIVPM